MNSSDIPELSYPPSPLVEIPSYLDPRENAYDIDKMENQKEIFGGGSSTCGTLWLSNY
jgi:hypothetical protein